MPACPACGGENRAEAKFCSECGIALTAAPSAREERKVVTVLFCDLVGFTSRAESLDPEDVRAILSEYHSHVRGELERFGGTVEKFIGDAVVAVFGAPVAHEDDPERAVRAALVVRDWAGAQQDLQVRIAVNTGEALVSLDSRPRAGEGMVAGDVVNAAARMQAAAPPDGVLVGEATYRATASVIDYREADPVDAKGKSEPIRVWEALAARARFGVDPEQVAARELVGRRDELGLLEGVLARVRRERSPQLVTLMGEPGIGKSRLVYELFRTIERGSELTYWRQGRALPYGDGATFWPLTEIAKAHAGILETDSADDAEAKLRRALSEVLDDASETGWVLDHLRPLVGLAAARDPGADRREEAFAAWRRLFEALAERRPLVLVLDDLHWADEGMLDFVDHLVDWVNDVPLLVLCTTRPELLDRRPAWGAGKRNSSLVSLAPLSNEETAALFHQLLDRSVLPAEVQSAVLERAGGNPLYAEEFARLVAERTDGVTLPESIQGLIAARLDLLSPADKELLQDAAVVGRVFWTGALTATATDASEKLHALERREFVGRARRSSVAGETEYAFRHVLVRDVAYSQIPRAQRAEKHARVAAWLETLSADRSEDRAEMLAHHYLQALELASAAAKPIEGLRERAREALAEAGDRALALNAFPAAARFYQAALDLHAEGDPERGSLLFRYGRTLWYAGLGGAAELAAAADALEAAGRKLHAAEALVALARVEWFRGQRDVAFGCFDRALGLVRDAPPSREVSAVIGAVGRSRAIAGADEEGLALAREALAIAEQVDADEERAHALNTIGMARWHLGELEGEQDIHESLAIARSINAIEVVQVGLNNLAVLRGAVGDYSMARKYLEEAIAITERLDLATMFRFLWGHYVVVLWRVGCWHKSEELTNAIIASVEAGEPNYQETNARRTRARIRLARGDLNGALADIERGVEVARAAKDPQAVLPSLIAYAEVLLAVGRSGEAAAVSDEIVAESTALARWGFGETGALTRVLMSLGREPDIRRILDAGRPSSLWVRAARLTLEGRHAEAADVYRTMPALTHEAEARLAAAEALVAEGRRVEADEQLERALAFFREVGATAYVNRAETLRAATA